MSKAIVALVGRPNVGKSTLFNRLAGERLAVVHDEPGTTRDRIQGESEWNGIPFTVVDTGGIEVLTGPRQSATREPVPLATASEPFIQEIRSQAEMAIREADVIVLVTDATTGITAADMEVAEILRRSRRRTATGLTPVLVAVNKADNPERRQAAIEFYNLGLGEVFPISALHGTGTGDLLDEVVAAFPQETAEEEDEILKFAIVGRPNVGKSSLLNRLIGEERVIVSPIPGTTRDAIDTRIEFQETPVVLIDTAGIRRRGRIEQGVEQYSVLRALKAIQRADVALLLIDAVEGVTAQDAHIAGFILDENKSVVLLINKWDQVRYEGKQAAETIERIRQQLKFLDYVPVLTISAKTGQRVDQVLPLALRVQETRLMRISTSDLNKLVAEATTKHAPPTHNGRRLRIYFATQAAVDPPTFVFFVNEPKLMHFSYERFLENQLRERYGFLGTPLRLVFRKRGEEK